MNQLAPIRKPASRTTDVLGRAEIGFVRRDGASRLAHLYQRTPLRVLFPDPVADDLPTAVLVTTSGGLVGGDRLEIEITCGAGAALHVTAQAAEKIYRTLGPETCIEIAMTAEAGAWLEYLPPDTIIFDAARLRRHTVVDLAPDAGFLGGEILVFGRTARGERLLTGLVHDAWEIRRGGRAIWADAFHIDDRGTGGLPKIFADPACLDGATALATLICAVPRPEDLLEPARAAMTSAGNAADDVVGGITIVGGLLVARWLGRRAEAVRGGYAGLAGHLRRSIRGLPDRLPRLWHI